MSNAADFSQWLDDHTEKWENGIRKLWETDKRKKLELAERAKAKQIAKEDTVKLNAAIASARKQLLQKAEEERWSYGYLEEQLDGHEEWAESRRQELREEQADAKESFKDYLEEQWESYKDEHEDDFQELIEELRPIWLQRIKEK